MHSLFHVCQVIISIKSCAHTHTHTVYSVGRCRQMLVWMYSYKCNSVWQNQLQTGVKMLINKFFYFGFFSFGEFFFFLFMGQFNESSLVKDCVNGICFFFSQGENYLRLSLLIASSYLKDFNVFFDVEFTRERKKKIIL